MKKGFLFSGNSASERSNSTRIMRDGCDQNAKDENIPFIESKRDFMDSQHQFDEVQQAMQINEAFVANKGNLFTDVDFIPCVF